MQVTVARKLVAEGLGTLLLVAAVVGSGIMAQQLATDPAAALLCNTIATGGALVAILLMFGPVSGAQLNPAVTIVMAMTRDLTPRMAAGYIAEAETSCRTALSASPQDSEATHLLGIIALHANRPDEAGELFERAIGLNDAIPEFHNSRGVLFYGCQRFADAEMCFRRAVDLRPQHAPSQNNLGNSLQALGRHDEAVACFRRAVLTTSMIVLRSTFERTGFIRCACPSTALNSLSKPATPIDVRNTIGSMSKRGSARTALAT